MTRLALWSLLTAVILSLMVGVAMRIGTGQALSARVNRLHLADCDLPCWNGITLGESSFSEVKARGDASLTGFTRNTNTSEQALIWGGLDSSNRNLIIIQVQFAQRTAVAISLSTEQSSEDMPRLRDILALFGAPDCIVIDDVTGYSRWFYEHLADSVDLQILVRAYSAAAFVSELNFRTSNQADCQSNGRMSWRDFLTTNPAFLATL